MHGRSHIAAIAITLFASAYAAADGDTLANVHLQWGVRVPLRNDLTLAAVVYRPAEANQPLPAVFIMTPYMADNYHGWGTWFARRGYALVVADCRGRGNSDGTFEPFVHDATDGYDAVEWIAAQPWSNGKVGMWGISYMGTNQWATAKERPPHLATIIPAAAAHPGIDFPLFNNIFYPYAIQWLTMTSGVTQNGNLSGDNDTYWRIIFTKLYNEHLPFRSLDTLAGNPSPVFQKWVDNPRYTNYWAQMVPSDAEYAQLDIPILTVTGHYDDDQWGALEFYRRHMQHGTESCRQRHYLMIGPWDHGGCVHPKREVGGVKFGPDAIVDLNSLYKAWYDWTMGAGTRPAFLHKRVACYLPGPGAETWYYADSLDELTGDTRTLHLHSSDGKANDVFHSGWLCQKTPEAAPPDVYTYDPLDTTPGRWEQESSGLGKLDQTDAMTLGDRGVIYHTAPLPADTDIAGVVFAELYIELDVPDTDFSVSLSEITPRGQRIPLAEDTLRARYRDSLAKATLVEPGRVVRYRFDSFNFCARRLQEGSRLRLVVTCPNTIHMQKNYNSGGVVADETAADARTATVRIHHDAERPSRLVLPLMNPGLETQPTAAGQRE